MFKNKLYALFVMIVIVSCTKMDDNFKQYIENGEIEYSNKVDSIKTFDGWNRAKITASLFNAVTVKEVVVSWNGGENMVSFPYVKSEEDIDALEYIIPDLEEKSYQFSVYSVDNQGASSIKVDAFANVYGENYRSNLLAKSFVSTKATADELTIELSVSSRLERNSEFKYFDLTSGEEIVVTTMPEDESVVLSNVDFSKEVQYRTFYVPNEDAFDEFNSDWVLYKKPQNILDILSTVTFTSILDGTIIEIPNPSNTNLDVEFTNFVDGVAVVTNLQSSDNPIIFEVNGLENGQQDVYLGLNDVSQNQVVETFSIIPISLVPYDSSTWTIHSFSSEFSGAGLVASNVIDGNLNTYWTDFIFSSYPHFIVVDMGVATTIEAFQIFGDTGQKGHVKHEWYISDDGVTFQLIGTFDMDNTTKDGQKNVLSTPQTGRYFKYVATDKGTTNHDYVFEIKALRFQ